MKSFFVFGFTLSLTTLLTSCDLESTPTKTNTEVVVGKGEQESIYKEMTDLFNQNESTVNFSMKNGCIMTSIEKNVTNLKSKKFAGVIHFTKTLSKTKTPNCGNTELSSENEAMLIENPEDIKADCIKSITNTSSNVYRITNCDGDLMIFNRAAKTLTFEENTEDYAVNVKMLAKNYSFNDLYNDLRNTDVKFARYDAKEDTYIITRSYKNSDAYSIFEIDL